MNWRWNPLIEIKLKKIGLRKGGIANICEKVVNRIGRFASDEKSEPKITQIRFRRH